MLGNGFRMFKVKCPDSPAPLKDFSILTFKFNNIGTLSIDYGQNFNITDKSVYRTGNSQWYLNG